MDERLNANHASQPQLKLSAMAYARVHHEAVNITS
jgi:hypothetical protein